MIGDAAGGLREAEALEDSTGGRGRVPEMGRAEVEGRRSRASEAALDEGVAEEHIGCGAPLLLHKHLPQEVPACVGHTLGKRGLCRLRGNLKNGGHGLVFGPRRLLGQHFHNGTGNTPVHRIII